MASPSAPDLDNTSDRQAALQRYHVLDTPPEEAFDRITSLAAAVCDVPTSLITLIDTERQWFKSCFGFDERETDLDVSFCVYAVDEGDLLVVEDAMEDPRFEDNPLVTGPPHIRFYAGAPLTTPEGIHIGTLCIIDYEPRPFDAAQREILGRLADLVVTQLERRNAEAQLRQLVDRNPQPMIVYARDDGAILFANEAAHATYGYDADTFASLTVDDLRASSDVPADGWTMHERRDGSHVSVRLRERAVQFNGRAARLAVPQRAASPPEEREHTVFFQTDLDGTVQSLSAEWSSLVGAPGTETVGCALLDQIPPPARSPAAEVLATLFKGEAGTRRHETRLQTEQGPRPVVLDVRAVRGADGTPTALVGTLRPAERPETASPSPDAVDGTHDLFPPNLPSFDQGFGAPSHEELSDLTPEPFDFAERLRRLVEERESTSASSDVELRRSLPESASMPVRLDPDAVDEVIGTILDNALRHTEEGLVEVQAESSDDEVRLRVADTGTGVEERFMEAYRDVASDAADSLPHVHRRTRQMGGSLNMAEGNPGTTFTLTLPRS